MIDHRSRVTALAVEISIRGQAGKLQGLDSGILKEYLQLHDLPKLMTLTELQKYGFEGQEAIYETMARFYGARLSDLPTEERESLRTTIDELNRIERILKRAFFDSRNLSHEQIETLEWIENIVDITDTGISRKSEMNITGSKYNSASLIKKLGDGLGAELSMYIEDNYESLLSSSSNFSLKCGRLFQVI